MIYFSSCLLLLLGIVFILASCFAAPGKAHELMIEGQLWAIAGFIAYQTAWLQDTEDK